MNKLCFKKHFKISKKYFFKWMPKSSFLTSITYSLTPSMLNLVKVEARCFIKRFARRSKKIRGWKLLAEAHLFWSIWLANRSINNQSGALSQIEYVQRRSRCTSKSATELLYKPKYYENPLNFWLFSLNFVSKLRNNYETKQETVRTVQEAAKI